MTTDYRSLSMEEPDIIGLEIDILLETLKQRYSYDFSSYARASLDRRIRHFAEKNGYSRISEIIPQLIWDPSLLKKVVYGISVPVTEFFRNPRVFRIIREKVFPLLETYPHIKIWNAGCATGQEVYSIAIMLKEEGLYDKTQIYATDFNDEALGIAREGIYSIESVRDQIKNYQQAGGKETLTDYYLARYNRIIFDKELKKNIVFANHNLISDSPFGEMHLILCRNVLIYFNQDLQGNVLDLFMRSLIHGGFLCLGSHESIRFSSVERFLSPIEEQSKVFKKVAQIARERSETDVDE